jgi:hypothetical protein
MAHAKAGSGRRWLLAGVVMAGALFSFTFLSGGCQKKESASEKAGREAREAYEKSKVLLKEGVDKGTEAAKESLEKSKEAAKDFQKGWKEGGKESGKPPAAPAR